MQCVRKVSATGFAAPLFAGAAGLFLLNTAGLFLLTLLLVSTAVATVASSSRSSIAKN
jgi:hypothetical protein